MRIYEISGLARSGHHAMINWIIKNLAGAESTMDYKLTAMDNLIYINEANFEIDLTLSYIKNLSSVAKVLMLSYENDSVHYSVLNNGRMYLSPLSLNNPDLPKYVDNRRVVFIRDFYNNLASRVESNNNSRKMSTDSVPFQWEVNKHFVELWKSYAKHIIEKKCIHLKYEDWLLSKDIRNEFMLKLVGQGEYFDNQVRGTSSSFGQNGNVFDRISQVEVPEEIKEINNTDQELKYYIEELGYKYRKL